MMYAFTICMCKDGAIYDRRREVLDFLVLADAVPGRLATLAKSEILFQRMESALRALALYWVLRAAQEQKLNLCDGTVKAAYCEIIDGSRLMETVDGEHYFVRPVSLDDPLSGLHGTLQGATFGELERCIPTFDAYLASSAQR